MQLKYLFPFLNNFNDDLILNNLFFLKNNGNINEIKSEFEIPNSKKLKIIQYNIDGILTHKNDIFELIEDHSPDIFCIQECNKQYYDIPIFNIPGYTWSSESSNNIDDHGKVSIISKNELRITSINFPTKKKNGPKENNIYTKWIYISGNPNIALCSYYKSPTANSTISPTQIQPEIDYIKKHFNKTQFLICDDFNAHHHIWNNYGNIYPNNDSQNILDFTNDNNFLIINNPFHRKI